jgi:hypothetical protein
MKDNPANKDGVFLRSLAHDTYAQGPGFEISTAKKNKV